ncbi:MAG: hypothetical protein GY754_03275 [bacterium]|nr:hypothetical protein [bacterium]
MNKKMNKKILLLPGIVLFFALVGGACSKENLNKKNSMIVGTWNLVEHIKYGAKKDYFATLQYKADGTGILTQYESASKEKEKYTSVAKWKLDDGGTVLVWFDDKDIPDENWTILHLSKRGLSLKRTNRSGTISRRLRRIK